MKKTIISLGICVFLVCSLAIVPEKGACFSGKKCDLYSGGRTKGIFITGNSLASIPAEAENVKSIMECQAADIDALVGTAWSSRVLIQAVEDTFKKISE